MRWAIVIPASIIVLISFFAYVILFANEKAPSSFIYCLDNRFSEVSSDDEGIRCKFTIRESQNGKLYESCIYLGGKANNLGNAPYCTITYFENKPTCYTGFCN